MGPAAELLVGGEFGPPAASEPRPSADGFFRKGQVAGWRDEWSTARSAGLRRGRGRPARRARLRTRPRLGRRAGSGPRVPDRGARARRRRARRARARSGGRPARGASTASVIHVVTVHWQRPRWIEPQLRFLRAEPARRAPRLRVAERDRPRVRAQTSSSPPISRATHSEKLNRLAEVVREDVGSRRPLALRRRRRVPDRARRARRARRPRARRDPARRERRRLPAAPELLSDDGRLLVRHRRRLAARATSGRRRAGSAVTDVGGNLLGILTERSIPWRPLLRSNRVDLDPLWFGVYDDVAYHHGAGFRLPLARRDELPRRESVRRARRRGVDADLGAARSVGPSVALRYRVADRRHRQLADRAADDDQRLSDEVFEWIRRDDEFTRHFLGDTDASASADGRPRRRDDRAPARHPERGGPAPVEHPPPSRVGDRPRRGRRQRQHRRHRRRRARVRRRGELPAVPRLPRAPDRAHRDARRAQGRATRSRGSASPTPTSSSGPTGATGSGSLLADVPDDIVGVNFDMKLFLPTDVDRPDEPVFMSRSHRSALVREPAAHELLAPARASTAATG